MTMIYGSVCSGIEAATVAWHPLGWKPAFFSEIEKFPSAVLAHHYHSNMPGDPIGNGIPNYGDMTKYERWPDHAIDILVGGTPCQSFSIAGLRKGLDDPRGNLMLTYLAIARRYQPRWLVWENVPGVLSSNNGRDFAAFIQGLEECGYHAAWRVLDAQYVRVDGFGRAVPQRRRRVFVVGYLGDWRRAAAVLFEREGMQGHPAPSRKTREEIAGTLGARTCRSVGAQDADNGHLIPFNMEAMGQYGDGKKASTIKSRDYKGATDLIAFNSREDPEVTFDRTGPLGASSPQAQAIAYSIMPMNSGKDYKARETNVSQPLMSGGPTGGNQKNNFISVFDPNQITSKTNRSIPKNEISHTLPAASNSPVVFGNNWSVRRLMPVECERLQGFADSYTQIPWRNKESDNCPDGPRYKALGNSMAVNVMRWIGQRIEMVEDVFQRAA